MVLDVRAMQLINNAKGAAGDDDFDDPFLELPEGVVDKGDWPALVFGKSDSSWRISLTRADFPVPGIPDIYSAPLCSFLLLFLIIR